MAKVCVEFDAGDGNSPMPSVRSYVATVGDGSSTTFNVTHSLGTSDVMYSVRDTRSGQLDSVDVSGTVTGRDSLRLQFATPPAAGSVRVLVLAASA